MVCLLQKSGLKFFGFVLLVHFLLIATFSQAMAASPKKSTIMLVEKHFAKAMGLDLHDKKLAQKLRSGDMVSDLFLDQSKVYYVLIRLYEKWGVKDGQTNLTSVRAIALYLEKHAPKLKKKKTSLFRGLGFGRKKEAVEMVEAMPPTVAPRPAPKPARTRGLSVPPVSAPVMAPQAPSKKSYIQTVFYATNRAKTGDLNFDNFYNGARSSDHKLHYGIAKVNIPLSHKTGQMELPLMGYSYLRSERSHIYLRDLVEEGERSFFSKISAKKNLSGSEKDLLVYIHGFNVSFEEAIRRAGQIAFDFRFAGTPIAFSWPSDGSTTAYNSDREDAIYSAKYLEQFLEKLSQKNPGRKIHIIAHSMGSQALLHGLRLMAAKNSKKRFASVILAAPDFDAELFQQQIAEEINPLGQNWTIYASEKDYALWASHNYNSVARLGTPLSLVKGYQIIDASNLQVTPWNLAENHSYYATKKVILDDMVKVLKGLLPKERGLVSFGAAWKLR